MLSPNLIKSAIDRCSIWVILIMTSGHFLWNLFLTFQPNKNSSKLLIICPATHYFSWFSWWIIVRIECNAWLSANTSLSLSDMSVSMIDITSFLFQACFHFFPDSFFLIDYQKLFFREILTHLQWISFIRWSTFIWLGIKWENLVIWIVFFSNTQAHFSSPRSK